MADPTTVSKPKTILRTHDLMLSYGRLRAVDHLNLSVRAGEIYGFLGRNGAGKTSTIRMLMGVVKPDAGQIELLDYRGRRIRTRQKQRIGYVSQEQHFYPWMDCRTLGRFVSGFFPTWDHDEFNRLLKLLELPPRRRVSHLSGGMRVKLALALALAHRPPILILDEPTSGLDPVMRREFLEIISRQSRAHDRTTFFSSHLIDEVERVADRVGIIHRGQLRYEGDIATLQDSVREVTHAPADDLPYEERSRQSDDGVIVAKSVDAGPDETTPVDAEPVEPTPADADAVEAEVVNVGNEEPAETSSAVPWGVSPAATPPEPKPPAQRPATAFPSPNEAARREFLQLAERHGFVVLRDGFCSAAASVVYGPPSAWAATPFGARVVRRLSLEDIFISMAAEATPVL